MLRGRSNRRLNLNPKKNRNSSNPFVKAFVPLIVLLFLGFTFFQVFHRSPLSMEGARRVNKSVCLKYYQTEFAGIIAKVGIVRRSKVKVILFEDSTIVAPHGMGYELPKLSVGDSLYKAANSFSYVIFPWENRDSSFVLNPYEGYSCDMKKK